MSVYFSVVMVVSVVLTVLVAYCARAFAVLDAPDGEKKRHGRSVPLLGGIALFGAFWLAIAYALQHPQYGIELLRTKLIAAFIGSSMLLAIGVIDDIKPYSARIRFFLVVLAIAITVAVGGGLTTVTNPFGGIVKLGSMFGSVLVFGWLLGMTFTTKILDGLDGLATGITLIGAVIIVCLTQTKLYYQPNVSLVAIIFAASCLGFLLFNFYPARIFLGESGSMILGFMLGVLAVIGGGKLATTLLVMALPIVDLARVMYRRYRVGQSIFTGDRQHLHFKLVDAGISVRQSVLIYYVLALVFGVTTLFLQSIQKVYALLFAVVIVAIFIIKSNNIQK